MTSTNRADLQIKNWQRFANVRLSKKTEMLTADALRVLNEALQMRAFINGDQPDDADSAIWSKLRENKFLIAAAFDEHKLDANHSSLLRWMRLMNASSPCVMQAANKTKPQQQQSQESGGKSNSKAKTAESSSAATASNKMKFEEGGKFLGLKDATPGKVVVRFPPEASGYLHIGHAKAALLNQHYKEVFEGRLIFRFDDTNPSKEYAEYEQGILEDARRLQMSWDVFSHTSDHFEAMLEHCTKLVAEGRAYADDTDADEMKQQREQMIESKCRNTPAKENLRIWSEMQKGSSEGQRFCIRVKFQMNALNGCMRDPTIYRCKFEDHLRTGNKYKVYPTYDFACPIVDSVEGVTHALRSFEYQDREEQYYAFIDLMGLRKPNISVYSRLNMQHTVLSKRKLAWMVEQRVVQGWDDPRMPTIRGMFRRGLTLEGLKQFVLAQGSAAGNTCMEWDKLWAFNRKCIDPVAPRFSAISAQQHVRVRLLNWSPSSSSSSATSSAAAVTSSSDKFKMVALHPKDAKLGEKRIHFARELLVERGDAEDFVCGSNVTFINWGNLRIAEIRRDAANAIQEVTAELNLEDTDFKNTLKVTWLANDVTADDVKPIPAVIHKYDLLISKDVLGKDEDFKQFVNKNSKTEESVLAEPEMRSVKRGDILQLQRRGFFICDRAYSPDSCDLIGPCESEMVLIQIPEGNTKERSTTGMPTKDKKSANQNAAAQSAFAKQPQQQQQQQSQSQSQSQQQSNKKKIKEEPTSKKSPQQQQQQTLSQQSQQSQQKDKKMSEKQQKQQQQKSAASTKKQTRLGLEARKNAAELSDWYSQAITKSGMIEYYDVSGCYTLLPWSFEIWSRIRDWFSQHIRRLGVKDCYFPMFVSSRALEQEKTHIADFAPEVAWVTHSGQNKLDEPIAIRPTSETVMYPSYARRVQSHRDLPIRLNQWCNVVRWEFSHPQPFLRSREFLWQEGHSAFARKSEAELEVRQIAELYRGIYEHLLAIPVVPGRKTDKEKFAGGDYTLTVEVYVEESGRGSQAATSHHLGQNFSRMFGIKFEAIEEGGGGTKDKEKEAGGVEYAYQNSWGVSTRSIGLLVMVHGDDRGIVLPPRVAEIQAVVIPCGITAETQPEEKTRLLEWCDRLARELSTRQDTSEQAITAAVTARNGAGSGARSGAGEDCGAGVDSAVAPVRLRVHADLDDQKTPGWKFSHWELKGVPLRLEVGPNELANGTVTVVARDDGYEPIDEIDKDAKQTGKSAAGAARKKAGLVLTGANNLDGLAVSLCEQLTALHMRMLRRATLKLERGRVTLPGGADWSQFQSALDNKKLITAPFCLEPKCEEEIKKESAKAAATGEGGEAGPSMGAKSLCIPFQQPEGVELGSRCINPNCKGAPRAFTMFGRSY